MQEAHACFDDLCGNNRSSTYVSVSVPVPVPVPVPVSVSAWMTSGATAALLSLADTHSLDELCANNRSAAGPAVHLVL